MAAAAVVAAAAVGVLLLHVGRAIEA